jgi:hypothetical protein
MLLSLLVTLHAIIILSNTRNGKNLKLCLSIGIAARGRIGEGRMFHITSNHPRAINVLHSSYDVDQLMFSDL